MAWGSSSMTIILGVKPGITGQYTSVRRRKNENLCRSEAHATSYAAPMRSADTTATPVANIADGGDTGWVRLLAVVLLSLLATEAAPAQIDALRTVAQRSDAVVLARCIDTRSDWDPSGRVIVTDATLAVERTIMGRADSRITLRTLGGRVGPVGMGASHAPTLAPGARVVAWLRRSRFGPYFVITSAAAGPLAVDERHGAASVTVGDESIDVDELARRLGGRAR